MSSQVHDMLLEANITLYSLPYEPVRCKHGSGRRRDGVSMI